MPLQGILASYTLFLSLHTSVLLILPPVSFFSRYSEFVELHNQLMKDYYKLPKLPPKKLFGSSMEVDFITARQRELE